MRRAAPSLPNASFCKSGQKPKSGYILAAVGFGLDFYNGRISAGVGAEIRYSPSLSKLALIASSIGLFFITSFTAGFDGAFQ